MALRNVWNRDRGAISHEKMDITNQLTFNEANYKIIHILNDANGEYLIKNNDRDLIKFSNNGDLLQSSLRTYILDRTNSINNVLSGHNTRLNTLESSSLPENQDLNTILSNGNNASGLNITNLNNLELQQLKVKSSGNDDIILRNDNGELNINKRVVLQDGIYGLVISTGLSSSGNVNFFNSQSEILVGVSQQENTLYSGTNASLLGFSNIDTMQNDINELKPNDISGTSTNNDVFLLAGVNVLNNRFGIVYGKVYLSNSCCINFEIRLKKQNNGLTIENYIIDYSNKNNELLIFDVDNQNLIINAQNFSTNKYKLKYNTDFSNL